jgi:hypothetical protein
MCVCLREKSQGLISFVFAICSNSDMSMCVIMKGRNLCCRLCFIMIVDFGDE